MGISYSELDKISAEKADAFIALHEEVKKYESEQMEKQKMKKR